MKPDARSDHDGRPSSLGALGTAVYSTLVTLWHVGVDGPAKIGRALAVGVATVCIAMVVYWYFGFDVMYPGEFNGLLGFAGFGPDEQSLDYSGGDYTLHEDLAFQSRSCAYAALVVALSCLGRLKWQSTLSVSIAFGALLYPVVGSWKWGGGWLDELSFYDFSGGMLVHGLAGAVAMGIAVGLPTSNQIQSERRTANASKLALALPLVIVLASIQMLGHKLDGHVTLVIVNILLATLGGALGGVAVLAVLYRKFRWEGLAWGAMSAPIFLASGADTTTPLVASVSSIVAGAAVLGLGFKLLPKTLDPNGVVSLHCGAGLLGSLAASMAFNVPFFSQLLGTFVIAAVGFGFGWALSRAIIALAPSQLLRASNQDPRSCHMGLATPRPVSGSPSLTSESHNHDAVRVNLEDYVIAEPSHEVAARSKEVRRACFGLRCQKSDRGCDLRLERSRCKVTTREQPFDLRERLCTCVGVNLNDSVHWKRYASRTRTQPRG